MEAIDAFIISQQILIFILIGRLIFKRPEVHYNSKQELAKLSENIQSLNKSVLLLIGCFADKTKKE